MNLIFMQREKIFFFGTTGIIKIGGKTKSFKIIMKGFQCKRFYITYTLLFSFQILKKQLKKKI